MGRPMRRIMGMAMGQYCTEGKHIMGFRNLWLTSAVGMSMRGWSNFSMAYSACMIGGGQLAAACIRRFGRRGYSTLSNITNMIGYACWASPRPLPMWLGLAVLLPGINAVGTSASKSLAVDLATARGQETAHQQAMDRMAQVASTWTTVRRRAILRQDDCTSA